MDVIDRGQVPVRGTAPLSAFDDTPALSAYVDTLDMSAYGDTMRVQTVRQLGAAVRGNRLGRGWSQADLAQRAQVSRQWIVAIEGGKATAEIAPVLRTLAALGLMVDIIAAPTSHGDVDLDELLGRTDG